MNKQHKLSKLQWEKSNFSTLVPIISPLGKLASLYLPVTVMIVSVEKHNQIFVYTSYLSSALCKECDMNNKGQQYVFFYLLLLSQKDPAYFYGYVYFRQVRDKSLKRGYFQKVNSYALTGKLFLYCGQKFRNCKDEIVFDIFFKHIRTYILFLFFQMIDTCPQVFF